MLEWGGMKNLCIILALVAALPLVGQETKKPQHWGAAGQMPAARPTREDAHQRALRQYDVNKNGKLDAAEREAMRKAKKAGRS